MRYIVFAIIAFSASLAFPAPDKTDDKQNAEFNGCTTGIEKKNFIGLPEKLIVRKCIKTDTPTVFNIPGAPDVKIQCGAKYCKCGLTKDSNFPKGPRLSLISLNGPCKI